MITNIPFLYVNIIALSCFTLMFVTFLATKKTPEIWAFLAVLLDCILWAGGSILMRLQMWPSLNFWYTISLVALFSVFSLAVSLAVQDVLANVAGGMVITLVSMLIGG